MQRKFISNLVLLVFLNLLVKPFYILGIDTEFIIRLGQSSYGSYFALLNLSILMNIFLDFGIVNFNTGTIARNEILLNKHFKHIMGLRMALAGIYVLITLLLGLVLGYGQGSLYLLLLLCLNQVLAGFILYLRSNLAGLQLYAQDSLISVLDRLVLIGTCSYVLWFGPNDLKLSVELFVYLQTAAYVLALMAGLFLVIRKVGFKGISLKLPFSLLILKKSFPYALLVLLMGFYYRTDGVMLERMLDDGPYQAGIYAQAFRFYEAGNMLALLFSTLLFPMFSRLLGQKKNVQPLLELSFKILTCGAIFASCIGFFQAVEIMDLRYDTEIQASSQAFKYLMFGFFSLAGTYIFGALLTANQSLRALNTMAMIGVFLNIGLNLLLIPTHKAEGAAFASMVTQILMAIYQVVLVRKEMDIHISGASWLKMAIYALVLILSFSLLKALGFHWITISVSNFFIGLAAAFGLKLISVNQAIRFFQLRKQLVERF
ncbi:MAG: polysaccharide biosynthesis C-terminal domain-containing protein [Vicingaceae bacterium]